MLVWNPAGVDDALWTRLREHFSEEEFVELGSFVCLTFGQQRVIKTWGVGHGELLADTTGGLAGGQMAHLPGRADEIRSRVPAVLEAWE